MTVYEIPNIEHCTITPMGTFAYKIKSNEGWYIRLNDGDEETANVYKTVVILATGYNFEQVEVVSKSNLPEGADICA